MAQAHPPKFELREDLDIAWERSRDLMRREQVSAQIEEAAVAYEDARRMYAKCRDEARERKGRMNEVSRRFARLVTRFQIGP